MKALEATYQKYMQKGVSVIGIAHRGDREAAKSVGERLKVSYPLLLGTASSIGRDFAAGDSLYISDEAGAIRFSQPGYASGDEALWQENIDLLLASKPVVKTTTERKNLNVGDRFPAVALYSLMTGDKLSLTGTDGHLTFTDAKGTSVQPKAAIGLLARYCAFTREEMVQLQKLHEKYGKDGLLVFTVALHPRPEAAKALTRELGVTYPVFEGHGSDLEKQYGFG
jgi:peroxiredoxin